MILWLKLFHILAAMTWFGGGLMLFFLARRARAAADGGRLSDFAGSLAYIGPRVLAPAVVLVAVTGIWMVLADAGYSFELAWVRIGLGLFVVALLVGGAYLGRVGVQMGRAEGAALGTLIDRWSAGFVIVLVILLFTIADMVFKPVL